MVKRTGFQPDANDLFRQQRDGDPNKLNWYGALARRSVRFLLKNANSNLKCFKLPLDRVIELGTRVEM